MTETLSSIAGVAGSVTTILGCCVLFIKPVRNCFIKIIKKKIKDEEQDKLMIEIRDALNEHIKQDQERQDFFKLQSEALLGLLRSNITHMYYKYIKSNGIPNYERENIIKQYNIYHRMHGNSYVDIIYEELLQVPVIK